MEESKREFRADLHIHSYFSDGSYAPCEIIKLAKEEGLEGIALTDHDSIEAYSDFSLANTGIKLISGCEFSCKFRGKPLHILGYGFSLTNLALVKFLDKIREKRRARAFEIIKKFKNLGISIEENEIYPTPNIPKEKISLGRLHIAYALYKRRVVKNVQAAFHLYLTKGKPCYVSGVDTSVEEVIELVHKANGKVFIAHPHLIKFTSIIGDLLNLPFDGLEGYYSMLATYQERIWITRAEKKGWLITGGSDFHGKAKPNIPLGSSWTNEKVFNELYQQCKVANHELY